ncbi:MAG: AAA family ATPase, partial [Chloroflexi bacterium]|nr:AAA family ATPase [Chloroflexota bacterium]
MDEQDGTKAQVSGAPSAFRSLGAQKDGADRGAIRLLNTGVPGLDAILGGGLPEYSFNIIAGPPGSGKTTLAQQLLFATASPESPAVCFTILGEPSLKMMRYQQQFRFFDTSRIGECLRFVNLATVVLEEGLNAVLDAIIKEVESTGPSIVVVDSFRTIRRHLALAENGEMRVDEFVHRLAIHLTGFQATTFLIGEYSDADHYVDPVFTVADGILALTQSMDRNSAVRKLLVVKMRGAAHQPGFHPFRITQDGLQVFPRKVELFSMAPRSLPSRRLSTGVTTLDEMMCGGIPSGDSVIIAGPSGSGKTAIATHFLAEGGRQGEAGVVVVFEESPADYLARAEAIGCPLLEMVEKGKLVILSPRSLDLSVDESLQEVLDAVNAIDAKRVVFD